MTLYELHRNFDLLLDKSPGISSYPSFLPEEKDYFYNTYIERFIKTRYSGLNIHKDGFQQSQKRTDDLRTVVKSMDYSIVDETINDLVELGVTGYYVDYPADYWLGLGETMFIEYPDPADPTHMDYILKRGDAEECTIENIDSKLNSSLSPYRLHNGKARPLRLLSDNKLIFYTDGNYTIPNYTLTYIAKPDKLDYYAYPVFDATLTYAIGKQVIHNDTQYICKTAVTTAAAWDVVKSKFEEIQITIMPDHTWDEITIGAVRLALENISEPRYQTISQESQMVE
jgi:hypothetical protein